MATEPLEYRITFDTSEVAQKLSEVKNAMDVAFGAQAFNAAGPDVFPFQQLFQTSALTNLTGAAPVSFGVPESLSTAMTSAREGMQMARGTFGDVQNVFNRVAETARLGYSKFTRDLEMTGLMAGGMRGAPQPMAYGELMGQIQQGGFLDDLIGGKGFGYSPTMPISRKEYISAHRAQTMEDFMEPSWGEAIGVGVGAAFAGGPVGWGLVGIGAAALGTKAALYPFTSELRHQRALESYVRGTSWRFLSGQFNREDTEGLGKYLRELPDQPAVAARGYGRGEVDEMLGTFTEAGGFDYVRNAREYREKTKQLFEGHRELMHTLHVSSKEAVALMGQLSRDLGVENFRAFSGEVGVLADRAGLTRTEAASFIMKSSEMVRGTGYNMQNFALGAGRMLEDVRNMAQAGIISQEDLRQFGGEQGIALSMARSAMNFAGSPAGFVSQAALMSAQLGGGGLEDVAGMGMQQQLGATAGLLSSPMAFARLFGAQQRLADEIGPEGAMQQRAMMAVEEMQMIFGRQRFTSEELFGALRVSGRSVQEAKQITWLRDQAGRTDIPGIGQDARTRGADILRRTQEEGETPFDRSMRRTLDWIEDVTWKPVTRRAETLYTAIERGTEVGGRALGRAWTTFTGGIFEVDSTKMPGLESAWRIGGRYAEKHAQAMGLNAEQAKALDSEFMNYLGDGSAIKIAKNKYVERTEEEKQQRGTPAGGPAYPGMSGTPSDLKLIKEQVTLDKLSAAESSKELEGYLENLGREENLARNPFLSGVGRLLAGVTYQGRISTIIGETAEDIDDLTREELQADLARSAAMAGQEYLTKRKAGEIGGDISIEKYTRQSMREDLRRLKLGPKQREKFFGMIGELTDLQLQEFQRTGVVLLEEDRVKQQKALRDLAIRKIEDRGEKADDAAIEAEQSKFGRYALLADLSGTEETTLEGRIKAGGIHQERLAASIREGVLLFGKETDAGGFVFDEQTAKITNAVDIHRMSEKLTTGIIKVQVITDEDVLKEAL